MLSCIPFCCFQRSHHENKAAHAATIREFSLEEITALPSPERLSLRHLSDQYDDSRLGVLVLAYTPCRVGLSAETAGSITAAYCNSSVAALFAVSYAEGADVGGKAGSVLEALQRAEPALFGDLRAQLLRFAASDPTGNLSLYLQAKRYSDDRTHVLDAPSSTSRRWAHASVEPILLEASFGACNTSDGVAPRQKPNSDKVWQARSVRPVAGAEASTKGSQFGTALASVRGMEPGIMVIFQPVSSELPVSDSHTDFAASTVHSVGPLARSGASFDMPGRKGPSAACHSNGAATITVLGDSSGRPPQPGRPGLTGSASSNRTLAPRMLGSEVTAVDCARIREGAVLDGLTTILTTFTADGKAVLYQNHMSVAYYGVQPHGPLQTAIGGGPPDAWPSQASDDLADSILGKLFSLEPSKLARMVAEVCMEGRVWKGIVQVPVSCRVRGASSTSFLAPESSSLAAVNRSQGARPSPLARLATGGGSLRQSLGCVPETVSDISPDGATVAAAATDDAVSGGGGDGTTNLERAASAPPCSSMSNAVLLVTDGAPIMDVGGLQNRPSTVDVDPLATSIWGLLMDTNDPISTQRKAHGPAQTGECTSVFISAVSSMAAPIVQQRNTTNRHLMSPTPLMRKVEIERTPSTGGNGASTVGVPAAVPWGFSGASICSAADASGGAGGLPALCRARFPRSSDVLVGGGGVEVASTQDGQGFRTGADDFQAGLQVVRRTASMVTVPQKQLLNGVPQPAFSRVIAFASNLKTTPRVVQHTLQRAVSGSVGCAGVGAAVHGTFLEYASSSMYTTAPASPQLSRDKSMGAQPWDRDAGASPKSCEQQKLVFMCLEEQGAPTRPRASSTGLSPHVALTAAVQRPPSAQSIQADRPSRKDLLLLPHAINGQPVTVSSLPAVGSQDSSNARSTWGGSSRATLQTILHRREGGRDGAISKLFLSTSTRVNGITRLRGDSATTGSTSCGMKPTCSVAPIDCGATLTASRTDPANGGGTGGAGVRRVFSLGYCWHEITATRIMDPISGQYAILVTQVDVTAKVEAERHLAFVTEAEHRLLEQIFPRHVLAYMTEEDGPWAAQTKGDAHGGKAVVRDINKLATSHAKVTLLFADIQGFTPTCTFLEPRLVMAFLNDLFTRFDKRLDDFGVYKVETIGDCYFVAGGLIHEDEHGMPAVRALDSHADPLHAEKVFMFAQAMLEAASQVPLPTTGAPVRMRIGIHSGPVVSGVVGQRMPRFCLFGDTVNTASRMESTGVPGCIHASEAARRLLPNESWIPTGGVEVKGKGIMNTYLWAPPGQEIPESLAHNLVTPLMTCTSPKGASVPWALSTGAGAGYGGGGGTDNAAGSLQFNSCGGFAQVWPSEERCSNRGTAEDSIDGLKRLLLPEEMQ